MPMRTLESIAHVYRDERGRAWIDETNTKVTELVMDWLANRCSMDELQRQHPHLSLAQIHAAFAYYYDHKSEIEQQISESLRLADDFRSNAIDQPSRAELEERLKRKWA
jgi:uncharacterized protein (DUF433 family)